MADINEELSNIYAAARQSINDDLKLNFYNAAKARNQAFRVLNNNANAKHALYSGMPAATMMQYDQKTYLPGIATMTAQAIAKQQANQDSWDQYMGYVNALNEQADYYNNMANQVRNKQQEAQNASGVYGDAVTGFEKKPTAPDPAPSGYTKFAE